MRKCCRRDLQQLAAEVEALREQLGRDAADRDPEGPDGSNDSSQRADTPAHDSQGASANTHCGSEADEPGADAPGVRALARRVAALEAALSDLSAAQERAHGQVSAGLASVTQQLDSLQVHAPSEAAIYHASRYIADSLTPTACR